MTGRFLTLLVLVLAAAGFLGLLVRFAPGAGSCASAIGGADCAPPTIVPAGPPSAEAAVPTVPSSVPLETPGPSESPQPQRTANLTFDDEFDGTDLRPGWQTTWGNFGLAVWSRQQASISNGILTITAQKNGNTWTSAELDTVGHFAQRYGTFAVRALLPQGTAIWPAFWLAQGWQQSSTEIDVAEVCANPPGTHDGNDATVLHNVIHLDNGPRAASAPVVANLTGTWHVFAVDWRADRVVFSVDGTAVSEETDPAKIPTVPMSVALDLAVGGWCGVVGPTTPATAALQVDWVRVSP